MGSSIYSINKGINKPIEFKGLKGQYIWFLAGGMIALMVLFAILYISGVNAYLCVVIIMSAGGFYYFWMYSLSNKYGEHGVMKMIANRRLPKVIKINSRKLFTELKCK